MTTMNHDGYVATIELDEDAGILHGRVINTRAILTFEGRSVDELKAAFSETIDDYKEWCRERGVEPDRPYSGTLSLRLSPDLHRRIAEAAAREGESINAFVADALARIA
jgi:predicted HicB family RNase H-like nuclease